MIAFEQIPIDVLRYILCMLEAHDLLRVQLTCVRLRVCSMMNISMRIHGVY